jgi:hypothetical protein
MVEIAACLEAVDLPAGEGARRAMRAAADDQGPGGGLEGAGGGRVIAVGMRDDDMGHRLLAHGVEQRRDMRRQVGSGIDDGDPSTADDVATGALERERARIAGQHAPNQGAERHALPGGGIEILIEGERVAHGCSLAASPPQLGQPAVRSLEARRRASYRGSRAPASVP